MNNFTLYLPKRFLTVAKLLLVAVAFLIGLESNIYAQCTNGTLYGTVTAPAAGVVTTIATNQYQSEYSRINTVVAGQNYISNYDNTTAGAAAFITVRYNTFNGAVVASGTGPLAWTAGAAGTYFVHYNTNASCGTASNARTSTIGRGVTTTACSGTFTDLGGGSNYGNNQTMVWRFFPSVASNKVRLTFSSFSTENNYDGMLIYDGNSTSAPLISSGAGAGTNPSTCRAGSWRGSLSGASLPKSSGGANGQVTSTAADGSLTIVFTSDGATTAAGWSAAISCVPPPDYAVTWSALNTGPASWCAGETRNISITATNNGVVTWVSGGTGVNFSWWWDTQGQDDNPRVLPFVSVAPGNSQVITFSVTAPATAGTYTLNTDLVRDGLCWFRSNSGGCGPGNALFTSPSIVVKPIPTAVNAGSDVSTVCAAQLNGSATGVKITATGSASPNVAIPDNNVTGVSSTISVPSTCANANNLSSVTINITHTYTGDLDISLIAPNGSVIDLSSDNGGTGDNYTNTVFSTTGSSITGGTAPFTGTYTPEQAFSTLTGSAQGNWTLRVVDDLGSDVGTLVNWSLNINGHTCPEPTAFSWSPAGSLSASNISNPVATPATTTTYTMTATSNGCSITDQVIVTKDPLPMTGTTTICVGATTDLAVTGEADWTLPTGGSVTTVGNDRLHTFNSTDVFTTAQSIPAAKILVIGGGGGGGSNGGGGGGAGALVYNSYTTIAGITTATVGTGGTCCGSPAGNGNLSQFGAISAAGGGGGASRDAGAGGQNGASGGGGGGATASPRHLGGTATAGGNGGNGTTPDAGCNSAGGGGGGAGGPGGAASNNNGGTGGLGLQNNITGANLFYAAGGGGGTTNFPGPPCNGSGFVNGLGGSGVGGNGEGTAPLANTGSGGGAEGAGADGVVMIRYRAPKWTSSNARATVDELTGVVTGVSAGTATITYTNALGCTSSTVVTIQALPTATVTGPAGVCQDATSPNITFTGASGTAPYTFVYKINNGADLSVTTIVGNSVTVPVPTGTPGDYEYKLVSVTESSTQACSQLQSGAHTITVHPTPTLSTVLPDVTHCNADITSAIPLAGTPGTVAFNYTGSGAAIGLSNGTGVSEIPSFTATNNTTAATTRTITVTPVANGCSGSPATFDINVNPTNRITTTLNNIAYCNGVTAPAITLVGTPTGVTYDISGGASVGLADATGQTEIPSFTPVNAGATPVTVTVTVTPQANGCLSVAKTYDITVNPTPTFTTLESPVLCFGGNSGSIEVTGVIGAPLFDFSRNNGGGYIDDQANPYTFTGLTAGNYDIVVKDDNGCISLPQTVNVSQPAAALTATATNGSPYAVGVTANLFGNGVNGTPGYTYQWSGPASFNSVAQNPTRTPTAVNQSGIYRVTVTDANLCTATAQTTLNVYDGYVWTGAVSSDWNNNGNWSFQVPDYPNLCGKHAIIQSGTPNPPVVNIPGLTIGNLSLLTGATLQLDNDIAICGNFTGSNGTLTSTVNGTGVLTMSGGTNRNLTGRVNFNTLRVDKGSDTVKVGNSGATVIGINTALELKSGHFSAGTARVTFKSSSPSQIAVLDNFSGAFTGTFGGSIKAERYYAGPSGSLSFSRHQMSSPINNLPDAQFGSSGTPGFLVNTDCDETVSTFGTPYGNVMRYDEANGGNCSLEGWENIKNTILENARGYSVRRNGSGVVTVTGTPNLNTSYTRTGLTNGSWSNGSVQGTIYEAGWHIAGNPYLAYLDLQQDAFNNNFDLDIQVWHTFGPNADSYVEYTPGTDAVIAPFGAFMVHKSNPGGADSYRINGSDRSRLVTANFFRQSYDQELIINADNDASGLTDRTKVAFLSTADASFDPQMDARKPMGSFTRHTLFTNTGGVMMSRNVLRSINETSTVPMGFYPGVTGSYTLRFDGINSFDPTSYVYVEDLVTGTWHNVRTGNYTFTATQGDDMSRFVLHFTPAAVISQTNSTCDASGAINMIQEGTANWQYSVENSASATVASGTLSQSSPASVQVPAGVYTITLTDNNGYTVVRNVQVNGTAPITASMSTSVGGTQITGQVEVLAGEDITFDCTTPNPSNIDWDMGDGTTLTNQPTTISYQYQTGGIYTVNMTVTNTDGCQSTASRDVVVATMTSLSNITDSKIRIFGFENSVLVDFTNFKFNEATVQVYNLIGQELSNEKVTDKRVYKHSYHHLEAAYVIVKVKSGDDIISQKVFLTGK